MNSFFQGAKVDQPGNKGYTPLFWAILEQKVDAVKYLINMKSKVNILSATGMTPFWMSMSSTLEIAQILVEAGNTYD